MSSIGLTEPYKKILLGSSIYRCNKMHLCSQWGVEWRFQGGGWFERNGVMPGRMEFLIDGRWELAHSLDEDVIWKMKDNK